MYRQARAFWMLSLPATPHKVRLRRTAQEEREKRERLLQALREALGETLHTLIAHSIHSARMQQCTDDT